MDYSSWLPRNLGPKSTERLTNMAAIKWMSVKQIYIYQYTSFQYLLIYSTVHYSKF